MATNQGLPPYAEAWAEIEAALAASETEFASVDEAMARSRRRAVPTEPESGAYDRRAYTAPMAHAVQPTIVSPADYLAFERESEERHEYLDGAIVAMSAGTFNHAVIAGNIAGEMHQALSDRLCWVCPASMRIKIEASERYTYADVAVVCGAPRFEDDRQDTLLNPCALFEVLSPSTESYDRGEKFAHYRTLASLTDYVLVSQKQVLVEHFQRQEDGGWLLRALAPGERLALPSLGCDVAVDRFYLKVFEDRAEG
jgi:Uma2 family endonuclease